MQAKVSGSTLIEVIIATVIIMAVFSIALAIFTKVTQSGYSVSHTISQARMQSIVSQTIQDKDYQDQRLEADSILYIKTVTPYTGYEDLFLIRVEAQQEKKKIGTYQRVIRNESP